MTSPLTQGCLNAIHPLIIVADPHCGMYSGALYLAWPRDVDAIPKGAFSKSKKIAENYWSTHKATIGMGMTPNDAYEDLYSIIFEEGAYISYDKSRRLTVVA